MVAGGHSRAPTALKGADTISAPRLCHVPASHKAAAAAHSDVKDGAATAKGGLSLTTPSTVACWMKLGPRKFSMPLAGPCFSSGRPSQYGMRKMKRNNLRDELRSLSCLCLPHESGGFPVICIDARHAKAALSLKVNKTDANDAWGLARIMLVGWYREVSVKEFDCYAVRVLLMARAQLVSQITALKNCVRGILKTFGLTLPKGLRSQFALRVRQAIEDQQVLARLSNRCCRFWLRRERTIKQYGNGHAKTSCPPIDVGAGRRHGRCPDIYVRCRRSGAI